MDVKANTTLAGMYVDLTEKVPGFEPLDAQTKLTSIALFAAGSVATFMILSKANAEGKINEAQARLLNEADKFVKEWLILMNEKINSGSKPKDRND